MAPNSEVSAVDESAAVQQMDENTNKFIVKYHKDYYDITDFLHKHPGGINTLKGLQNADMTGRFMKAPPHSDAAMYLMREYLMSNTESNVKNKLNDHVKTMELKDNIEIIEEFNEHDGNNKSSSGGIIDESMEHLVDWSKAILPQIPKTTQHYDEWVHKPVDRPLRLFGPWYLEMLTKTPWWVVPTFWLPVIFKVIYDEFIGEMQAQNIFKLSLLTLYFLTGILFWTLIEYSLHRYVFHIKIKPNTHPWICTFHFMIHGLHHKVPFDSMRLVFPPLPGAIIASIIYAPISLCLPQPRVLMAGTLFGYLCYDMIHYYLHYGSPSVKHLYNMKRYHYQHHFAHQDMGYGISSSLWDFLFNTRIHLRKLRFHLQWK